MGVVTSAGGVPRTTEERTEKLRLAIVEAVETGEAADDGDCAGQPEFQWLAEALIGEFT